MDKNQKLPDFDEVKDLLNKVHISLEPSEAHGVLCGMISAKEHVTVSEWIIATSDEPSQVKPLNPAEQTLLKQLVKTTHAQIESEDYTFSLLLPDDEVDINTRTAMLGLWCQGFMAGLGISGCYINEKADNESSEALRDLCEISRVTASLNGTEEEERAFFEVVEYVRAAVMLIMRSVRFDEESSEPVTELLH